MNNLGSFSLPRLRQLRRLVLPPLGRRFPLTAFYRLVKAT